MIRQFSVLSVCKVRFRPVSFRARPAFRPPASPSICGHSPSLRDGYVPDCETSASCPDRPLGCPAARADEHKKFEKLCRYIGRPAIAERHLSLMPNGNVRQQQRLCKNSLTAFKPNPSSNSVRNGFRRLLKPITTFRDAMPLLARSSSIATATSGHICVFTLAEYDPDPCSLA